jgi:ABC-type glycerol-3-phosphate transport system permease component
MMMSKQPHYFRGGRWLLVLYCIYLFAPLYWLLTIAMQSNADILGEFTVFPSNPTLSNFKEIMSNAVWYQSFVNSLSYVIINTVISISVALYVQLGGALTRPHVDWRKRKTNRGDNDSDR